MEGTQGLSTLGTVIVDYRGHRVVCQSVMPGEGGEGGGCD